MENLKQQITELHRDIEEIKETLGIVMENYVDMMHSMLEKERHKFISLEKYKKKHGIRS